ncbi:SAM-dependent methyltransferase [bacterium]|nr:SAM-dependent methyltransferase [bacterium]
MNKSTEINLDGNLSSSFRDPSGFMFTRDGKLYRQVNHYYQDNFDLLIESGLYERLIKKGLLIPHSVSDIPPANLDIAYKIIKPEIIPFISYPYEWSFSQFKDAALTTLKIEKEALKHGMSLKDASAYNIQFRNNQPVFIDTLSFERYEEGKPWVAYKQFCQHFLAPLALMSYTDIRLGLMMRLFIDGIPLNLAAKLLPSRCRFKMSLFLHIYLHARSQDYYSDKQIDSAKKTTSHISKQSRLGLIDSLETAIKRMKWRPAKTEWGEYYDATNYSKEAIGEKGQLVSEYLDITKSNTVWDLGANTGLFSRIAAEKGMNTISFDIDPAAVEKNYLACRKDKISNMLPLLIDLTNPSPGIGWACEERESLIQRSPADTAMALALIHHLAISNNLPFSHIASFFKNICNYLIIEFVPKSDSQVKRLLTTREDIFPNYTKEGFEAEFTKLFTIEKCTQISGTERFLYLLKGK